MRGAATRVARTVLAAVLVLTLASACSGDDTERSGETTTTVAPETTTTTEPPLDEGSQVDPLYYVPTVGDCFDRREITGSDNKQADVLLMLDCQLLHQYEIFATVAYPLPEGGDTAWPGDDAVRDVARADCSTFFEAYIGAPYETSAFEMGYLLPPEDNFGVNQLIGCYVYDPTHDRTAGSAQRAAR